MPTFDRRDSWGEEIRARHGAAIRAPDDAPTTQGPDRRRTSRRRGATLVGLGRAVLALVPVLVVAGRLVAPSWVPVPDADHDTLLLTFVLTTLFLACATPWLLLPVGPASGVRVDDDGRLTVPTVLGTRHLDLTDLRRVAALTVWGRGGDSHYLSLRAGRRGVVLALGGSPQVPSAVRRRVGDVARERPEVLTDRARAMLGIAPVPSRARRVVLGVVAFVVGCLAYGAWVLVVAAAILATYVPFP